MDGNRTGRLFLNLAIAIGVVGLFFYLITSSQFSQEMITWGLLILVLVLLVGGWVYNAWSGKKRRETLQQTAMELGYNFRPEAKDFSDSLQNSSPFGIFGKGRNRKAYNILRGQRRDAQVAVFDYRYTTGGGRSSQTHYQTLVLFTLSEARLTPFNLKPRGFFDKIAARFGRREVRLEVTPEFSRRYQVTGDDEWAIRRVFSTAVVALLEQQGNLCCEASADQLLVYRPDKRVKPEDLRTFIDSATQLLDLMRHSLV